ncbi:MAG: hypothetical protein H7315_00300 [Herminiimonas sp.]|nr:hypothetical protein [Herminiimonas sp.]
MRMPKTSNTSPPPGAENLDNRQISRAATALPSAQSSIPLTDANRHPYGSPRDDRNRLNLFVRDSRDARVSWRRSSTGSDVAPETPGLATQQTTAVDTHRSPLVTKMPMELTQHVAKYLPAAAMAALSATNKTTRYQLNGLLRERKDFLDKSKTLKALPRERRFEALKNILSGTHPRADVLHDLINAYGHIPREHRADVTKAIEEKAALLASHERDEVRDHLNSHILSTTQGLREWQNLRAVDSFHDEIAATESLDADQQIAALVMLGKSIGGVPYEYRLDAIKSILEKANAPSILLALEGRFIGLPPEEMSAGWHAILDKAQDPKVLANLAHHIGFLPREETSAAWDAIFEKTQDPRVMQQLARGICDLPEAEKISAWNEMFENTQHPKVLEQLAGSICELPEADRISAWYAVFENTQHPKVLKKLAWRISSLPAAEMISAWDAVFAEAQDPEVLERLASSIRDLPAAERISAWNAIFEKTQHPAVLGTLAWTIVHLPQEERRAARDAIAAKTQYPQILAPLAQSICELPEDKRSAAWIEVFETIQLPKVLEELAWNIRYLPEEERRAARDAIVAKIQDPAVLGQLPNIAE